MNINLPNEFDTYDEMLRQGFLKVKDLKEEGQRLVGVFCSYTPSELIYACDAIPIGLCGGSDEPINKAEVHLPKNLCPLIKSSYGSAVSETCPYFYFSDLIVGETTCDGKKKMYEIMNLLKPTYVINLPQGQRHVSDFDYMKSEMLRFKEYLEEFFHVEITDERLKEEIKRSNKQRKILKEYYELGKLRPSPLSGYESNLTMEIKSYRFNRDKIYESIEEKIRELRELYENQLKHDEDRKKRPRIMITGCPTIGVRNKIIKRIEDFGVDIVVFDSCGGIRDKENLVREDIDPIDAIAQKYLEISCSIMTPNQSRLDSIERLVEDFQVDAVIEIVLQACHTFAVESFLIKDLISNKLKLPYLYLETDYSTSDSGQIDTRINAFLEILD